MKKIKRETSSSLTYTPFENIDKLLKQSKEETKKEDKKHG